MSTLDFDSVTVRYGHHTVLDRVSLSVPDGQVVGLVGESGSGKSVTALSIMRLTDYSSGRITNGQILFQPSQGGAIDLARVTDIDRPHLHAESRRHGLNGGELAKPRGRRGIPQHCGSRHARRTSWSSG